VCVCVCVCVLCDSAEREGATYNDLPYLAATSETDDLLQITVTNATGQLQNSQAEPLVRHGLASALGDVLDVSWSQRREHHVSISTKRGLDVETVCWCHRCTVFLVFE
jgi:hypothetical protein